MPDESIPPTLAVPMEETKLDVRAIPPVEVRSIERTRAWLAVVLVCVFVLMLGVGALFIETGQWADGRELIDKALTIEAGAVGGAIAYYFGRNGL